MDFKAALRWTNYVYEWEQSRGTREDKKNSKMDRHNNRVGHYWVKHRQSRVEDGEIDQLRICEEMVWRTRSATQMMYGRGLRFQWRPNKSKPLFFKGQKAGTIPGMAGRVCRDLRKYQVSFFAN